MAKKMYVALRGKTEYNDYDDCETTFVCSPEYFENFVVELDEEVPWRIQSYLVGQGIKLVELIPQNEAKIDIKRLIDQFEAAEEKRNQETKKRKEKSDRVRKMNSIDEILKNSSKDEVREALEAAGYIEKGGVFIT